MTRDVSNLFSGTDGYLEEVIIVPIGDYTSGTFSLPGGYVWTDFEYIEFWGGNSSDTTSVGSVTLNKGHIAAFPTSWTVDLAQSTASANRRMFCNATSVTSFSISGRYSCNLRGVRGYKKRYSTRNLSKIVTVNNGNDVTSNKRYEIDIATELGSDYIGRNLVVVAEINNDSGNGNAGWGDTGFVNNSSGNCYFVKAAAFDTKIIVQTGKAGLTANSNISGNPFGNTNGITSAPCRVKVWKVDQYVTNTAGNTSGAGITTLWENLSGATSGAISWTQNLSTFDAIMFTGNIDGYRNDDGLVSSTLPPNQVIYRKQVIAGSVSEVNGGQFDACGLESITETGGTIWTEVFSGSAVFTGVYGIRYS